MSYPFNDLKCLSLFFGNVWHLQLSLLISYKYRYYWETHLGFFRLKARHMLHHSKERNKRTYKFSYQSQTFSRRPIHWLILRGKKISLVHLLCHVPQQVPNLSLRKFETMTDCHCFQAPFKKEKHRHTHWSQKSN